MILIHSIRILAVFSTVATSVVTCNMLMLVSLSTFYIKVKIITIILNFAILVATSDLKNSPVFTDFFVKVCKTFLALATGNN